MVRLSDHLSLREAIKSNTAKRKGIENRPDARQVEVMSFLAKNFFEVLRYRLGGFPIHVSSFYRSYKLNAIIGGSINSDHMVQGDVAAIDLDNDAIKDVTGVTNADIFYYVFDNMFYKKLIWEFGDDEQPRWVHISFSTDHNKNKKRKTYRAVKKQGKITYLKFKDIR